MPHCYSRFWIAFGNGAPLAPIWYWKERAPEDAHPLEALPMHTWLQLSHAEQAATVAAYAGRTPRRAVIGSDRHRRGGR